MSQDERVEKLLKRAVEGLGAGAGPCLDSEHLVAFYDGRLSDVEMEPLRDHIAGCPACTALAREVRGFLAGPAGQRSSPRGITRGFNRRLVQVAAVFTLGALLGLSLSRSWGPAHLPSWQEMLPHFLVKKEWAPPVASTALLWRDGEPPKGEAPKDPFAQAMQPYTHGEFAAAAAALRGVLEENPFHEPAVLHLGISLLLDHKTVAAAAALEGLAATATAAEIRDDALWYGALARLDANEPQAALVLLDRLLAQPPNARSDLARFLRILIVRSAKS